MRLSDAKRATLLLAVTTFGVVVSIDVPSFKLRLLHTNDMHARFEQVSRTAGICSEYEATRGLCYGGFARVQTILKNELARANKENVSVLSLNAGDTYQGTVWYTVYKWKIVSHFLKKLPIDAMAFGNHEFDDGIEGVTPFLRDVGIPVLAANIDFSEEPQMMAAEIQSHKVFERNGRKIGVIGYLTPDTIVLADVGKLKFKDEIETLKQEAKRLKEKGVDIIIALGHSGYEVDLKIAAEVLDVDVIVGGHSHTFLYTGTPPDSDKPLASYPVIVTQKSGRKVAMVQAYAFTKYLGLLDLVFDERGELIEAKGNPILLNEQVAQDPEMLQEVKEWGSKLNATLKQSIGKAKVLLDASLCRFYECNLGNLITDAFIHLAVKSHSGPFWTKAAIAIQQAGGIRTSINATATNGTITREDVITSMPFFTTLSIVRISGKHLLEALEWSVARYDPSLQWGRGEFLQMSGIKVKFEITRPPGSRVISAKVRCQHCYVPRLQNLKKEVDYDVIMPTFLFKGGDNFIMFKEHGREIEKLEYSDTEAVIKYIQQKEILYSAEEDRIDISNDVISQGFSLKPLNFTYLFVIFFVKYLLVN